jgi:hypothetical protein
VSLFISASVLPARRSTGVSRCTAVSLSVGSRGVGAVLTSTSKACLHPYPWTRWSPRAPHKSKAQITLPKPFRLTAELRQELVERVLVVHHLVCLQLNVRRLPSRPAQRLMDLHAPVVEGSSEVAERESIAVRTTQLLLNLRRKGHIDASWPRAHAATAAEETHHDARVG